MPETDYDPDETANAAASESKKQEKPKKLSGLPELMEIVRADEQLSGIQFNDFCNMIEFTKPTPWNALNPEDLPADGRYFINDTDYTLFRLYIEETYEMHFRIGDYTEAMNALAKEQHYHPIKKFLAELPEWDKVPRVDTLLHDYLGAEDSAYTHEVMRKTLCAAVIRIYRPGTKYDAMPVLLSDLQLLFPGIPILLSELPNLLLQLPLLL